MSTFTSLTYHVVFGTKYRRSCITADFRDNLYSYIGGIIRDEKGHMIEIGGMPDHVHILVGFAASVSVSDMLRQIKSGSSKWINESRYDIDRFEWQTGYGAFTVSQSQVDIVRRYIQRQEEHHCQRSFRDEFVELLNRHHIPFEDRFLFEGENCG